MSILDFFRKQQSSNPSDSFEVKLVTEKVLTEEQKDSIIKIVNNGVQFQRSSREIISSIELFIGITDPIILNKDRKSNIIKVIF